MTIVTIDSLSFCPGNEIAQIAAERLGWRLVKDEVLVSDASKRSGLAVSSFRRLIDGPPRLMDSIRDSRSLQLAALRVAVANALQYDDAVIETSLGYVVPQTITHVMKTAVVASRTFRVAQAIAAGVVPSKADQLIKRNDESRAQWASFAVGRDPWDVQLFDMILPADEETVEAIADRIVENARKSAVETTPASLAALDDYRFAAKLQLIFAQKGHDVDIISREGDVEILIKNHTLFLERLQQQLVDIALSCDGVKSATARPGPKYQEANIYLDVRGALPSKVLLVDDERSFVQTLSKRLKTREIDSVVAFGGAEALIQIQQEEPEVMVLDLKMPGIDGLEVLRTVKATNPKTEVIILTAHGSAAEERLVFQLGAFAYLRKPVDIEELTDTLKRAYQKVQGHA